MSLSGHDLVAFAVDEELGLRARPHGLEIVAADRQGDAEQCDTRGSAAAAVSATHEPNDMPAAQSGAPGYRSLMKSSAALKSSCSPTPCVERAGAQSDAAEVEAQHGAADPRQRFGRLVHDLRVHRPAIQRVRMREDDGRAQGLPAAGFDQAVSVDAAAVAGSSSSASSGPTGPGISRSMLAAQRDASRASRETSLTIARTRRTRDRIPDDRCARASRRAPPEMSVRVLGRA